MNANDIRDKYLNFFKFKDHVEVPSAPLVPENDPSTLFTSSGMQPMIPYLLGEKHPLGTRIVDSQKCIRAQDMEEVGDSRHTTFFEMLGNWSLGDYFNVEQIEYIFTFLTDKKIGLGIDPNRLFFTTFEGEPEQKILSNSKTIDLTADSGTVEIWRKLFAKHNINIDSPKRYHAYPSKKNWWSRSGVPDSMPLGEPGGPDSEVFYDFGAELKLHENSIWKNEKCHINCDCGRFFEIGNNVFMKYKKQADKLFVDLPAKNIDFGGGLSRCEAAMNNDPDMFNISSLKPLIKEVENISQKSYSDEINKPPMRVIADHITAATFLIKDGVIPGNKAQGYLVRRLIRRAMLKLYLLTENKSDLLRLNSVSEIVIKFYGQRYFDLNKDISIISAIILDEIKKFSNTIDKGIQKIDKFSITLRNNPEEYNSGNSKNFDVGFYAFDFYQNDGFPLEMTYEELDKNNIKYNKDKSTDTFDKCKNTHQELSRTLSAGKFKSGLADHSEIITKYHTATHLLHQSLRNILGNHVSQSGSNITSERLRFDFSHPDKLTDEQLKLVTDMVNDQINKKMEVTVESMKFTDAQKSGALAFFGNKYPEIVTVYQMGDFSREVCTGPHVKNTTELGKFTITRQESAGGGKRRIYAILE